MKISREVEVVITSNYAAALDEASGQLDALPIYYRGKTPSFSLEWRSALSLSSTEICGLSYLQVVQSCPLLLLIF